MAFVFLLVAVAAAFIAVDVANATVDAAAFASEVVIVSPS